MPEINQEELEKLKQDLIKEEGRRKIIFAENELVCLKHDRKVACTKVFFGVCNKYNISPDDVEILLEIGPYLT